MYIIEATFVTALNRILSLQSVSEFNGVYSTDTLEHVCNGSLQISQSSSERGGQFKT